MALTVTNYWILSSQPGKFHNNSNDRNTGTIINIFVKILIALAIKKTSNCPYHLQSLEEVEMEMEFWN